MKSTPISQLRAVGLCEGSSFLVLLFLAMPLKYLAGLPLAAKVVGWAHGLLFVLYLAALARAAVAHRWRMGQILPAFLASLVPFGPFLLDRRLRLEAQVEAERS